MAKRVRFALLTLALFFLGIELSARVGSYLVNGRNPYYLLYGFRSWSNEEGVGHTVKLDGYFKFPADVVIEYGTPEPARINSLGFRGADFTPEKPDGTYRVICMGASSTFGYLNADPDTYPVRLEGLLGEGAEVINSGIPHFTTDNILACLEQELLSYEPDLLTVYTGCNDAVRPMAETRIQKVQRVLDEYSAGYAALRKGVNATFGDVFFGQWTPYLQWMTAEGVQRQLDLHLEMTRGNFEAIIARCEQEGIPLVIVRQPITLWFERETRGVIPPDAPRTTYEEEYAEIAKRFEEEGVLRGYEVTLYVHHHLNEAIDELAREHGLTVVDNVALVAEEPEGLGSKVHLTASANARLAQALFEAIEPLRAGGTSRE